MGKNDKELYFNYLNRLIDKHASKVGLNYNLTVTMSDLSHFQDSGASGNSILNTDEAFKMLDQCDLVIGPYSSGQTKNIMPVFSIAGLPACSGSASTQSLENKLEYPHFIRTNPNDNVQGKVIAQFIAQMKWKRFNIMNNADAFALGVKKALLEEIESYNSKVDAKNRIKVAADIQYESYQTDFSLYLEQIKDLECTVTIVLGDDFELDNIYKSSTASQKALFSEGYVWLGADTFGSYSGNIDVLYSAPAADRNSVEFKKMDESFRAMSNSKYSLDDLQYAPFYLSCVDVFFKFISIAKKAQNKSTFSSLGTDWFVENSELFSDVVVEGPSGQFTINYQNDLISDFDIIHKFNNNADQKVAFTYSSKENKIIKAAGFQYNWSSEVISDEIDVNKIALTPENNFPAVFYIMIILSILAIIGMVAINVEAIISKRRWSLSRIFGSIGIFLGASSSALVISTPNTVIYSHLASLYFSEIIWNCSFKSVWCIDYNEIMEIIKDK